MSTTVPTEDLVDWYNCEVDLVNARQRLLDRRVERGDMSSVVAEGLRSLQAGLDARRRVLDSFQAFLISRTAVESGGLDAFLASLLNPVDEG